MHERLIATLPEYNPVERHIPPGLRVRIRGRVYRVQRWLDFLDEGSVTGVLTLPDEREVLATVLPPFGRWCLGCAHRMTPGCVTCRRCGGTEWDYCLPDVSDHAQQQKAGRASARARWGTAHEDEASHS